MVSTLPVGVPGLRMEDPLYVSISTSFPATMAAPTSRLASFGWPMRILVVDFGMKRTRPELPGELSYGMIGLNTSSLRVKDGIVISGQNSKNDTG